MCIANARTHALHPSRRVMQTLALLAFRTYDASSVVTTVTSPHSCAALLAGGAPAAMAALANTASAAAPAAAPAPGPAPGSGYGNDPNGPEDLVRVFVVITWAALAAVQAAAIARAGSWSCAGSGEAMVAPVAIAALVGAAGWAQSSTWGVEHGTLHVPLHVQVIGVFVGFAAAAMFASTHLHLGAAPARGAASGMQRKQSLTPPRVRRR